MNRETELTRRLYQGITGREWNRLALDPFVVDASGHMMIIVRKKAGRINNEKSG